jgi:hypothetical protein
MTHRLSLHSPLLAALAVPAIARGKERGEFSALIDLPLFQPPSHDATRLKEQMT